MIEAERKQQDRVGDLLAEISEHVDESNCSKDAEAILWGRVAKVSEECGEAVAALIGATGQNPRKGVTHTLYDVKDELLDVALTALAAVEHLSANKGCSMYLFSEHVFHVYNRLLRVEADDDKG